MEPTEKDLRDPLFTAIWEAIKGWDISRKRNGIYGGPTGTDVMAILAPIRLRLGQTGDYGLLERLNIAWSVFFNSKVAQSYRGVAIRWTGWKCSQSTTRLASQLLAQLPTGERFYSSSPGSAARYWPGSDFNIGTYPVDRPGISLDDVENGIAFEEGTMAGIFDHMLCGLRNAIDEFMGPKVEEG